MAADAADRSSGTTSGAGNSHDRARVVRRYLSALDARRPGRTPARTAESVAQRIHQIDTFLLSADPVQKLHLTQERIDLHAEQLRLTSNSVGEFDALERSFVRVARSYGDRHGITYSAWRQIGVDTDVLAKAGIKHPVKPTRPAPTPAPSPAAAPVAEEAPAAEQPPAKAAPARKAPAKKAAATKKQPAKAKAAVAETNGEKRPAKKAAAKSSASPEQQRLPAEAHLLS